MPAALTKSEHVRRVLEQNFDLSAKEVQDRLERKGISVEVGLIYNIKSVMKTQLADQKAVVEKLEEASKTKWQAATAKAKETRALNTKPLRQHIVDILEKHSNGLTLSQIIDHVRQTYVGSADDEYFQQNVRKKLRLLVDKGAIVQVPGLVPTFTKHGQVVEQQVAVEGGIAMLVSVLKQIVTKVGKQETKELIDVL